MSKKSVADLTFDDRTSTPNFSDEHLNMSEPLPSSTTSSPHTTEPPPIIIAASPPSSPEQINQQLFVGATSSPKSPDDSGTTTSVITMEPFQSPPQPIPLNSGKPFSLNLPLITNPSLIHQHSQPTPLTHHHANTASIDAHLPRHPSHHHAPSQPSLTMPTSSSKPSSRPGSAHRQHLNEFGVRLGAGPASNEFGEGLHSFRAKGESLIPLTGPGVAARTGAGAVDLAANLLQQLGTGEAIQRRQSVNLNTQAHPSTVVPRITGMPASGRRLAGPSSSHEEAKSSDPTNPNSVSRQPVSSRLQRHNSSGPGSGPAGTGLERFPSLGSGPGSGGLSHRDRGSSEKRTMIPLGRVGTMRSLVAIDGHEAGGGPTRSVHGSRGVSKVSNGSGRSSRIGADEDTASQKAQEIEGLDEFDAKHRDELKKRRQGVVAMNGTNATALIHEVDDDEAAIREAIDAKRAAKKQISPLGQKTLDWIDGGWGTLIMTLATIYALFGDDIRIIGSPKSDDVVFIVLSCICLVLFGWEFAAFCAWREDYLWTFFFFLDLIAVFSLIPDLPFIWDPFMSAIGQSDSQNQNLAVARAGRASRAGTRAGRLVRFIRLVRFLRVVKLYKYCGETDEERVKRELEEKQDDIERAKQEAEEKLISEMDSEIGKGFSDYITKCVIVMVLFMMFLLPLLEVTETDSSPVYYIQQLDALLDPSTALPTSTLLLDLAGRFQDHMSGTVIFLAWNSSIILQDGFQNDTFTYVLNQARIDALRTNEITKVSGHYAEAWVDIKQSQIDAAGFSIGTTLFVTILLAGGAAVFSMNANEMVILPIERMFLFVTKLAANPLGKIQPTGDLNQPFETQLLETTFLKLAGLLQIGFGAAGAEVISHNMKGDFLDPMVPGRKIFGIFGFCDIRKFGVVTEALGQDVMIFCNQVADIVHELIHMYGGAANKNLGNAFLLVWKPTVATIKKVSMMNQQAAIAAARELNKAQNATRLLQTATIAESDDIIEEEESSGSESGSRVKPIKSPHATPLTSPATVAGVNLLSSPSNKDKKDPQDRWAQRTPKNEKSPSLDDLPAFSPEPIAEVEDSLSEKRKAALAKVEVKPGQVNSINQPTIEATQLTPAQLILPSVPFRPSVSVANAGNTSIMNGMEASSVGGIGLDTNEYSASSDAFGADSGLNTTGSNIKINKRPSHSLNATGDSPKHQDGPGPRRGSAQAADLIPAAIPEVSKSSQETESRSVAPATPAAAGASSSTVLPSKPTPTPAPAKKADASLAGTKNGPMWDALKHLADQSLIAFLSTIKQVAITQELHDWRTNEQMRKLLGSPPTGDYEVDMGFGLHVGWAIEGAIGSIYKIDASYLSPNVNIASRLCGATKQYGVRILISGPLHSLMQPDIQRRCRHLDCITVKGSKLPLDIYTFDVGHLALKSPATVAALNHGHGAVAVELPHSRRPSIQLAQMASEKDDAAAPDIPVDDEGNPIDPSLLPKRPSELADELATKAARKERRGSGTGLGHLVSNGSKIIGAISSIFHHKDATGSTHGTNSTTAPATTNTAPPNGSVSNRIHPEEKVAVELAPMNAPSANLTIQTNAAPLSPTSPNLTSPKSPPKPKVESGDFTKASLASLCAQLQLGLPDDFVKTFNEASSAYIKGHWSKAKDILENKFLKQNPNDKPAKVLLKIMEEYNFVKPADWKGYRKLTAK